MCLRQRPGTRAANGRVACSCRGPRPRLARRIGVIGSGKAALSLALLASAAIGPAQPAAVEPARMLQRLRDDARDAACDVLIAALDGAFAARHVSDEELIAPDHKQVVHPADPVLSGSHLSTPTLAAACLAARKYTAALPRIRELAKNAAESDAELLRVAIAQLERVQ